MILTPEEAAKIRAALDQAIEVFNNNGFAYGKMQYEALAILSKPEPQAKFWVMGKGVYYAPPSKRPEDAILLCECATVEQCHAVKDALASRHDVKSENDAD